MKSFSTQQKKLNTVFLRGVFDSEGSAYFKKDYERSDRKIELCNTDLDLMFFCKNLLLELGIHSRKIDKRIRKERILKGRKLPLTIFYRFTLKENKDNLKLFRDLIGFSIERKQKNLEKMIDSYIYPNRNKWLKFKGKVLHRSKIKRYSELRQKFYFIPKSVIDHWIYPRNYKQVFEK